MLPRVERVGAEYSNFDVKKGEWKGFLESGEKKIQTCSNKDCAQMLQIAGDQKMRRGLRYGSRGCAAGSTRSASALGLKIARDRLKQVAVETVGEKLAPEAHEG